EPVGFLNEDRLALASVLLQESQHLTETAPPGDACRLYIHEFLKHGHARIVGILSQELNLRWNREAFTLLFPAAHAAIYDGVYGSSGSIGTIHRVAHIGALPGAWASGQEPSIEASGRPRCGTRIGA